MLESCGLNQIVDFSQGVLYFTWIKLEIRLVIQQNSAKEIATQAFMTDSYTLGGVFSEYQKLPQDFPWRCCKLLQQT